MKNPTFTLVLPTLNEIEGLKHTLARIMSNWSDDILVVDGGSKDGTVEYCREHGLKVIIQSGRGIPNAEKEALQHIATDYFVLFTPDGNSIPELLPALRAKTLEGYDMVIVSRYLDGAKSEDDDFLTAIGNNVFTRLINLLFSAKFTDTLVGFRSISTKAISRMRLSTQEEENSLRKHWFYVNSWEVAACTRGSRIGLQIAEIPGDEPKRVGGVRKLSITKNGLGGLLQILMDFIWFREKSPL